MRAQVVLSDIEGPGFYRLIAPGTVLQEQGLDIDFDLQWRAHGPLLDENGNLGSLPPSEYDVVVLQSPQRRVFVDCIKQLQDNGTAVVVEMDDDFFNIDREHHGGYRNFLKQASSEEANFEPLMDALKAADLVTVSTQTLADMVPNDNVVVLQNYVPEYYMDVHLAEDDERRLVKGDHLVVGWTGDPDLHISDLEVVGDGVVRAVQETESWFMDIGGRGNTNTILGFPANEGIHLPWQNLNDYPYYVKNFDIGIVPLADTAFNRSKTYLKGLEYAALGIPFVASVTYEYQKMNQAEVGFLSGVPGDWYAWLVNLIHSDYMRDDLIGNGLRFARANTYELHAHLWAEAWERAIEVRRAA